MLQLSIIEVIDVNFVNHQSSLLFIFFKPEHFHVHLSSTYSVFYQVTNLLC